MEPYVCPFTILVDTAEGQPFTFQGMAANALTRKSIDEDRPLIVPTRMVALGRYPNSLGDYSVDGLEGQIGIERKSLEDVQGTVLGWASDSRHQGRRDRFEQELANLAKIRSGHIVVEAEMSRVLQEMPAYGKKDREENRKIFYRSVLAYRQDYAVQWHFCHTRRFAEYVTFHLLRRFWQHNRKTKGKSQDGKEQRLEASTGGDQASD